MEQRKVPAAGEFYRDFKGNLYQVIGIAKHSETGVKMVVYQALYGDYSLYVRPFHEFMSPVDKGKYPEVMQTYRFEQVLPGGKRTECVQQNVPETEVQAGKKQTGQDAVIIGRATVKTVEQKHGGVKLTGQEVAIEEADNEESAEQVRKEILQFLDAEGAVEKLEVLRQLRKKMDENLITTIELSMDLLPDEKESLERRYELIEQTLEKRIRFEGGRLR